MPSAWRDKNFWLEVTAKNTVSDKQGIDKERSEYSSSGSKHKASACSNGHTDALYLEPLERMR